MPRKAFHRNLRPVIKVTIGPWVLTPMSQNSITAPKKTFEPLLTPEEAAAILQIHPKTLIKMARLGQVPALRIGKHWRFTSSSLSSFIDNRLQSTCQPA